MNENSDSQTALLSQLNWLNWLDVSDTRAATVVEYPFYSDADIRDGFTDGLGPYSFLNTVPSPISPDGDINAPIVLRAEIHLTQPFPPPDKFKTDKRFYHGGDTVDELAALTSVALGVRIRAGHESRRFEPGPGQDPYGQPSDWKDKPKPVVRVQPNRLNLILPSVVGEHPMSRLKILRSIPQIDSTRYVNLIRACKFYQEALWIAEFEPNLAWLMFVSALETAASDVCTADASPRDLLREYKPNLEELLKEYGDDKLVD